MGRRVARCLIRINVVCLFGLTTYCCDFLQSGQIIGTPSVTLHDDDAGDTFTYTMDCGTNNGRLVMDPAGQVTFREDYDLDTGSLPTSVSCSFTVRDSYGLNDTAVLNINLGRFL